MARRLSASNLTNAALDRAVLAEVGRERSILAQLASRAPFGDGTGPIRPEMSLLTVSYLHQSRHPDIIPWTRTKRHPARARRRASNVVALRRPRPADEGGARADARQIVVRALHARASRSVKVVDAERSVSKSAVSREFVGRNREHLDVAHVALARGHPAGGLDARRNRAQGGAGSSSRSGYDRRDQGPAGAVGRLDREQDHRQGAARRPPRQGAEHRAGVLVVLDGGKAVRARSARLATGSTVVSVTTRGLPALWAALRLT